MDIDGNVITDDIFKDYDVTIISMIRELNQDGVKEAIDMLELKFANLIPYEEFIEEIIKIANSTTTALFIDKYDTLLIEPKVGFMEKIKIQKFLKK